MSLQIEYLMRKEQYQDMIRAAQQDQLIQMVKQQSSQLPLHRQIIGWLGAQMVNWGTSLQHYGMTARGPSSQMQIE